MFNLSYLKDIEKILPIQIANNTNRGSYSIECIYLQIYGNDISGDFKKFMLSKIREIKLNIVTSDEYQNYGIIPKQNLFEKDCEIYDSVNLDDNYVTTIKKNFNTTTFQYNVNYIDVNINNINTDVIIYDNIMQMIDRIITDDISKYISINSDFLQFINCDVSSVNIEIKLQSIYDLNRAMPKFILIPIYLKGKYIYSIEHYRNKLDVFYSKHINTIVVGYIKPLVYVDVIERVTIKFETEYLIRVGVLYEDIMPFRCFYSIL